MIALLVNFLATLHPLALAAAAFFAGGMVTACVVLVIVAERSRRSALSAGAILREWSRLERAREARR